MRWADQRFVARQKSGLRPFLRFLHALRVGDALTGAEGGDPADRLLDVIDGDQARAFELARRALVARAPQEVLVVEAMVRIVPAAVAGVIVDHAIGRVELV